MDSLLTTAINGLAGHNQALDALTVALTRFGVPLMVLIVALHWWSPQRRPHLRHVALLAGFSMLLGLALNQGLLLAIHRVRPYDLGLTRLLIAPSPDWSFPSDHATASVAIAAAFLHQGLPRRTAVLGLLALLICLSRVYVGTHFVTDILGGAATGLAAALVLRRLFPEGNRLDRLLTAIL